MTLIETLQSLLNPLAAGGSWYQVNTAQPAVTPYIVFGRIASPANNTLQGLSQLQNTHMQIDIYARTVAELASIGSALEAALDAAQPTYVQLSSRDLYEPDTKLHRSLYEYSVWTNN